jgi:short subunit dehydrogenase-like uncharacterized protein
MYVYISPRSQLCKTLDGDINKVICDVSDAAAVERAVLSTKVVANFAGTPFADKAALVVEACAKHGRHYVDITGEIRDYTYYHYTLC